MCVYSFFFFSSVERTNTNIHRFVYIYRLEKTWKRKIFFLDLACCTAFILFLFSNRFFISVRTFCLSILDFRWLRTRLFIIYKKKIKIVRKDLIKQWNRRKKERVKE